MTTLWRYGCLAAVLLSTGLVIAYSGDDLPPGPYCGTYPNNICCKDREDGCSKPILGTLCYCDEFCNRTTSEQDDCCPDYFEVCLGIAPPAPAPIRQCNYKNKVYLMRQTVQENCYNCTCREVGERAEMVCDMKECMIDEDLIEDINTNRRNSWRAKRYEPFWGKTLKDGMVHKLGTLDPAKSTKGMYPVHPVYNPNKIPRSFNAMDVWGDSLSPVRDQGWCGSSWAISTADVASDKFAINSDGKETPMLSAQHLVSCSNKAMKCNGGHLDRAWQFIRKYGIVNEDCFPYSGQYEKCHVSVRGPSLESSGCIPPPSPSTRRNRYKVSPAVRYEGEMDIMNEIMTNGPVQATIRVYKDFFMYAGGVYKKSPGISSQDQFGYHSVRIVGWGEEAGSPFWVVANSWGTEWGENGFFRIARGVNECDIETYVISTIAFTVENKVGVEG